MPAKRKLSEVDQTALPRDYAVCGDDIARPESLDALLQKLADGVPGDYATQQNVLWETAAALMTYFVLDINGIPHRLAEVEAYIHHAETHPDVYTHCHSDQLATGCWYFHRVGPKGGYKGGTYKGMDLAVGNAAGKVHGGYLIRAVEMEDGELTEGPSLVVDRILRLNEKANIVAFVDGKAVKELRADVLPGLRLRLRDDHGGDGDGTFVYAGTRVGLTLRAGADHRRFCARGYRFSRVPHLLKKCRAGFAAHMCVARGATTVTVEKLLAFQPRYAKEYIDATVAGRTDADADRYLNRTLNNKDLCGLVGACCGGF